MGNKAQNKSILREIISSKARFISILSIIFLGVALYTGLKSTGPDLEVSISKYYKNQNLMDSRIVSSLGLNDNDLALLKKDKNILSYQGVRSIDVNLTKENSVVKFIEYNDSRSKINNLVIEEGRLPKKSGEIALDKNVLKINKDLKLGDKYKIASDKSAMENFNRESYTVVGFVESPMYIANDQRGTTTVGKGSIDYFAVLNSDDISMDVYTEIYVTFKNVENMDAYSDEYKDKMEENISYLKNLYSQRSIERVEEIKKDAKKELDKAYAEIEENESKLSKGKEELEEGKIKLADGEKQYNDGIKAFEKEIKDGEEKLANGEKALKDGEKTLNENKKQIEDGERQLAEGKTLLDKARDEFINQGIDPDLGTKEYEKQIAGLNTLIDTQTNLSKDIKNTVNNLNEENIIPTEKIASWKGIIYKEALGLSSLKDIIDTLEKTPENTSLAVQLSEAIEKIKSVISDNKSNLETLVSSVKEYQSGLDNYNTQLASFNAGKQQLEAATKQIETSKLELEKGKKDLEEGKIKGKEELEKAKQQLEDSKIELLDGEKELEENNKKLAEAREEIEKEEEKLKDIDEAKYYFFDRRDNPGYSTYNDSIRSLDNIALVFPVFFFLVAALICLTTMTRMVEENRIEIGTLKALGYSDFEVAKKFVIYASLASITGSIIGIIVGSITIPLVINNSYASMFTLPKLKIQYYPDFVIQSIIVSIVCTVGASLMVLRGELKEKPSSLMRAKAPKLGKKILLERITPLWRKFNFNQKVTLRNLFRYKQRMVMTILGIAGCTAMLVTGFALNKSNTSIADKQFGEILKYDAMVIFDDDNTDEQNKEYENKLKDLKDYDKSINLYQELVTFSKEGMNKQTVPMYALKDTSDLSSYISLKERGAKEDYNLSDDGAIISEKLAELLKAKEGETIVLTDENDKEYSLKIYKIAENYAGHFLYISEKYYKEVFEKELEYNMQLLNLKTLENEDEVLTDLMDCEKVVNVTLTSNLKSSSEDADLGLVMLVIIIASGSLAFIVLYNLININVSERIRELSTIKVLGFFDNEVTMYIFRENIILTIFGIFVGSFMGKMLYLFVINTASTDNMMMIPEVFISSYILSAVMTLLFAFLVMIMMHIKLKNVNMIDALKSVE